jgi:cytochrome c oxidase assembly protein subunit 15
MPAIVHPKPTLPHRLLHGWAVLTVIAAGCAMAVGSVVTTFKYGMTDRVWPTTPWHLFIINWTEPSTGYLIEHTHRLAAYSAGFCFTVFAVAAFLVRTGRNLVWLGMAALAGVIAQGVLGGARVLFDAASGPQLALIHGVVAQVVFSVAVAMALYSSPRLQRLAPLNGVDSRRAFRLSLLVALLALCQIIWGAMLRHTLSPLSQRGHLLTAFVVVAAIAWLAKTVLCSAVLRGLLSWPAWLLIGLVTVQLLLGVETFLYRFTAATVPDAVPLTIGQAAMRSLHLLISSWILAAAVSGVVLAMLARRVETQKQDDASESLDLTALPRTSDTSMQPSLALTGVERTEGRT